MAKKSMPATTKFVAKVAAPQSPAHAKLMADRQARKDAADAAAVKSKKKNDEYEAMKQNNRLNRGKKAY